MDGQGLSKCKEAACCAFHMGMIGDLALPKDMAALILRQARCSGDCGRRVGMVGVRRVGVGGVRRARAWAWASARRAKPLGSPSASLRLAWAIARRAKSLASPSASLSLHGLRLRCGERKRFIRALRSFTVIIGIKGGSVMPHTRSTTKCQCLPGVLG